MSLVDTRGRAPAGQPVAFGHHARASRDGAVAVPVSEPAPAIQKPLATPRSPGEPEPAQPQAVAAAAAPLAATCSTIAPDSVCAVISEPLSATASQARELGCRLSDGSMGPVTGPIQGPADMVQGNVPQRMSAGSVGSDALLGPDPCVSEVAAEALETIASMSAPAEPVADAAMPADDGVERCEAADSFMRRTSYILNSELVAAPAGGDAATAPSAPAWFGGEHARDASDSGRITVEDRVGVVSCHDSGTGALNRAAAAAAGVQWAGPPAVTTFGRGPYAAGSPDAAPVELGDGSPAVVALGGAVSRKERSARLSAALPSRLSIGPMGTAATAAGTERLQSVLARRRQSKMLRRQSSSSVVSGSLDLLQRTKSRRVRCWSLPCCSVG